MDILNPELRWIEDRCYRLLRVRDGENYEEDDAPRSAVIQEDEDSYDHDLPIIHQGNQFYITIHVPAPIIKHVVGSKGKKRQELEQTGAKVNIPHQKNTPTVITISGPTENIVASVYNRIEDIVTTNRLRTDSTHFVSLPMNAPDIKESFSKFKKEVLSKFAQVRGVDESIFQNPNKLHVTIAPLVLLDETDNQNAIAVLKKCTDDMLDVLGARKFIVQVKGIEYMNDDPAEVDVLYAKLKELDDDNRLQIIADRISKEFLKAKLSRYQHDKVKLHITVMNTLFRERLEERDECLERVTFDARGILKDFGDYDFGQMTISEMHISIRYTTAPSDGFYLAVHKIKLNA